MEIKATLNKPYTDAQRIEFIVEQNHKNGYKIEETNAALEAWGYTAEETTEQQKQAYKKELIQQLDEIDLKTIRSMRAIQAGTGTKADEEKLAELESQAAQIRQELKEL